MNQFNSNVESALFRQQLGAAVIDSLAQANIDLGQVSLEQVKQLLVETARLRCQSTPADVVPCAA